ncbi:MAG: RHS repeat protein, partial [Bacteroidales bacterium]|nr:RHS repeat protein [Bacteroidales bacterium]
MCTGNQLTGLTEHVSSTLAGDVYSRGGSAWGTYAYDKNGNMVNDSRRALDFGYNVLNLLSEVKTTGGELKATYVYLADGTRLRVRDKGDVNGFDYLGSLTYRKRGAGLQLESANFGDGVIRPGNSNGGQMEVDYFLTDHLGSVRVIVDGTGKVLERNDYYPFGARHARSDYPQLAVNRYKYNGKEEQVTGDLGYLDYGARMYDSGLGRWFGVDPLSENYL